MSKLRMVVTVGLLGLVLLMMLVFPGCTNKIKGPLRENKPPVLRFSNIPPDSSAFSKNPEVSWYAIDMDGYVTKYQYAVIIADSLHVVGKLWSGHGGGTLTAVDSACSVLVGIPHNMWVDSLRHIDSTMTADNILEFLSAVDTTTSIVKIQLFARDNPNDTISQYLFVRAIDNDSAISNIVHRMFNRNNHLPKAYINYTPFRRGGNNVRSVYCLPDTTETWKGIKITWEGADSDDYKGTQPNFFYKWELWGPFADSLVASSGGKLDSAKYNSLDPSRLVASSLNKEDSTYLVEDKSLFLTGLVNSPHLVRNIDTVQYSDDDLGYGWYLFIVWTQDDAFVLSDPFALDNPTGHLWFRIIHPQFTYQSYPEHSSPPVKKVLILDFAVYTGLTGSEKDSLNTYNFYKGAFNSLISNHSDWGLSYSFKRYSGDTLTLRDTLSRYNLIVYLNESDPTVTHQRIAGVIGPYFIEYMSVGGGMWAIGNSSGTFGFPVASTSRTLDIIATKSNTSLVSFVTTYFDLLGVYNKGWAAAFQDHQFIGAEPFNSAKIENLPSVDVYDKMVNNIRWIGDGRDKLPLALPHASAAWLGKNATRIYTFVSVSPDSSLNNKPCGSVCEGPIGPDGRPIRTAYLSFGLHFMKEGANGAIRDSLFEGIVGWLLED